MIDSFVGVRIEGGPSPFQIFQQNESHTAGISLHGRYRHPDGGAGTVQLRIVREADAVPVVNWQEAWQAPDGAWRHTFTAVPAGGLYRIESRLVVAGAMPEWGLHGDTIHHLGVGDLWIIAGQSNAAGYGRGPVDDPPCLGVHILRNDEHWDIATHTLNETTGSHHPNMEGANPAHSPYLQFGKVLHRELGWPIGLVQTALGGSALRAWNPTEDPAAPLYRNLLHCVELAGGRVRGMVWYQGESDTGLAEAISYRERFARFVAQLRSDLGNPTLSIMVTQLNRVLGVADANSHEAWSLVREAQRRAVELPHTAVVPALDLPLSDFVHNSAPANVILGRRTAMAALRLAYGRPVIFSCPTIATAVLGADRRTIKLTYDGLAQRLFSMPDAQCPREFRAEDDEGDLPLAAGQILGRNVVRLTLSRPPVGKVLLSSAYGTDPPCILRDAEDNTPALAFHRWPVTPA